MRELNGQEEGYKVYKEKSSLFAHRFSIQHNDDDRLKASLAFAIFSLSIYIPF